MRYYLYCDESISKGKSYSDFYGGSMINAKDFKLIDDVLETKRKLTIGTSELKWQKINQENCDGYIEAIDSFFDFVAAGKIKVRVMFTQNRYKAIGLTREQKENKYYLLYYQFIKHAFGLKYLNREEDNNLEIFLDRMPDKKEAKVRFIKYIYGLQLTLDFIDAKIKYERHEIIEVDSHKHIIMQYTDVVLGAMAFKLNKLHLEKNPYTNRRGKRTRAKEKVYKQILKRIREMHPNFNVGISTGTLNPHDKLDHSYRHWNFKASSFEVIEEE